MEGYPTHKEKIKKRFNKAEGKSEKSKLKQLNMWNFSDLQLRAEAIRALFLGKGGGPKSARRFRLSYCQGSF